MEAGAEEEKKKTLCFEPLSSHTKTDQEPRQAQDKHNQS
jgi:hypothetical protein